VPNNLKIEEGGEDLTIQVTYDTRHLGGVAIGKRQVSLLRSE